MKKVLNYIWARLNETSTWHAVQIGAAAIAISLQSHNTLWVALGAGAMAVLLPQT